MLLRAALVLALAATLTACGPQEEEPACCAIEPKAKCEAALAGMGVTQDEHRALFGPDAVCPSEKLSVARIRELDSQWPQACREAGMMSPQIALDTGACPDSAP